MKRTLSFIAFALLITTLCAQENSIENNTSGEVIYEQVVKLDIQLDGDASQFSHALPTEQKSKKILQYCPGASLYENYKSEENSSSMQDGGATVMITMVEPEYKVFSDLQNGTQVEQKEFMSRIFLIEKKIEKDDWKLTGDTKEILGYTCQGAELTVDEILVKAWFTPEIAVPSGPANYLNLPGLILEVDKKSGDNVIRATQIAFKDVNAKDMKKPSKGKKVSDEEFQAIVEEKMKEMGVEDAGGAKSAHTVVLEIRQ